MSGERQNGVTSPELRSEVLAPLQKSVNSPFANWLSIFSATNNIVFPDEQVGVLREYFNMRESFDPNTPKQHIDSLISDFNLRLDETNFADEINFNKALKEITRRNPTSRR